MDYMTATIPIRRFFRVTAETGQREAADPRSRHPAQLFETVVQFGSASRVAPRAHGSRESKKPFGQDLAQQTLNGVVHGVFRKKTSFARTTNLGKNAVQNLLFFPLCNFFSRALWNRTVRRKQCKSRWRKNLASRVAILRPHRAAS